MASTKKSDTERIADAVEGIRASVNQLVSYALPVLSLAARLLREQWIPLRNRHAEQTEARKYQ